MTEREPRFSVVVAAPPGGPSPDRLLASLAAQTFPVDQVEVLVVPDEQPAARDAGLLRARGSWVTFPEPGDVLDPNYLREVGAFLRLRPETPLLATRRLVRNDSGESTDTHLLRRHFSAGNRLRRLDEWTGHFPGPASSTFFPTAALIGSPARFTGAGADAGLVACRYLLGLDRPAVGFLTSARHHGRASRVELGDERRFTSVPAAYLELLRTRSPAPEWLQNYVLSALFGYFAAAESGGAGSATGATAEEFRRLLGEITARLEPQVVTDFAVSWTRASWRFAVGHAYAGGSWRQPYGWLDAEDRPQRLIRLRYFFTGTPPIEAIESGGRTVAPTADTTRVLRYFGRDLLRERILWLPSARALRVRLDGRRLDLTVAQPERDGYSAELVAFRDALPAPVAPTVRLGRRERVLRWLSRRAVVRRRFADAWVVMDRLHDANDSGERLFRHLRRHRPDINAWFVIEKGTPDFRRLRRREGRRVVAYGSWTWTLLMSNARHLISSHADAPVVAPAAITRLAKPGWRFTFLGHGVNQSDLSGWLNPKPISVFVTSTVRERESIMGEGPYAFTAKEVILTGLPRFDRLRALGRRVAPADRDLILIAPTWRHWLQPPHAAGSQRRTVYADFAESDFVRQWLALLRASELEALAARHGVRVGLLAHPNLQQAMAGITLPAWVERLSYTDGDVQRLFARTAVLVTDYSSVAADLAYIDRAVVYFQFDADRFVAGGHVGGRSYFDHRRDGFGPVTETVEQTVAEVAAVLDGGRVPAAEYARRAAEAFPKRDGRCCQRVVAAIEASTKPRRVRRAT